MLVQKKKQFPNLLMYKGIKIIQTRINIPKFCQFIFHSSHQSTTHIRLFCRKCTNIIQYDYNKFFLYIIVTLSHHKISSQQIKKKWWFLLVSINLKQKFIFLFHISNHLTTHYVNPYLLTSFCCIINHFGNFTQNPDADKN